jgi:AraC family transcriptional regulator
MQSPDVLAPRNAPLPCLSTRLRPVSATGLFLQVVPTCGFDAWGRNSVVKIDICLERAVVARACNSDRVVEIEVRPGAYSIFPMDTEFYARGRSGAPWLAVAATRGALENAFHRPAHALLAGMQGVAYGTDDLLRRLAEVAVAATAGDAASSVTAEYLALACFARLVELRSPGVLAREHDMGCDRRHRRVLDYIEAHFTEDLSIARLADIAALSPYHFVRSFRAVTGVTPYAFVMRRRVRQVQYLLVATTRSVSDIALVCGFASASHMSATFRRLVGVTPRHYIARMRGRERLQ